MHNLNGIAEQDDIRYSSQMNVIFPFKKILSKSLYQSQLTIPNQTTMDDILENSINITH